MNEADILDLVRADDYMMAALRAAAKLSLPDWVLGAGFVRNKVWDYLHGVDTSSTRDEDLDLVYFDPFHVNEVQEEEFNSMLCEMFPARWSCKNEARMHVVALAQPYANTEDAISKWPETATCVGVTGTGSNLRLIAPCGTSDLVGLVLRYNVRHGNSPEVMFRRIEKKGWLYRWPKLVII